MLAYVGDGNNVARSLAIVGTLAGVEVRVAAPDGFQLAEPHGAQLTDDPAEAAAGARRALHRRLGLDERRRATPPRAARRSRPTGSTTRCSTAPRPVRSPCTACPRTPARRSPRTSSTATRQRIWDQAENRRHAQKALLELLVRVGSADHATSTPDGPQEGLAVRAPRGGSATKDPRLREQLPRFLDPREVVVLTRERLQEALDDAVERGRMTRDDATALVADAVRARPRADRRPDLASSRRSSTRHADADRPRGRPRAPRDRHRLELPDPRLRRPDGGAGQRAPRRPLAARAAQGARLREAQREPQVGARSVERKLG